MFREFCNGTDFDAYERLGVHENNGEYIFRVWAPNALSVCVVGDFNQWSSGIDICSRDDYGVWQVGLRTPKKFDNYKYEITNADGDIILKSDPFAVHNQTDGSTASKVYSLDDFVCADEKETAESVHSNVSAESRKDKRQSNSIKNKESAVSHDFVWHDSEYLQKRAQTNVFSSPINIYECHIGSWRKYADGSVYSYTKFADEIVTYMLDMGFTHLELLGILEYPFIGSWGYQVTGYFAPTSRYGTPEGFAYLVDRLHLNGLAIIIDWVPAHFPKDEHGLVRFDGTPQFEYADPLKSEQKEWGTFVFDYAKPQVQSFLVSSASFWLDKFHVDGLRVDAVASMLYLDYGRKEWRKNSYGGNENLEAVAFFKKLNSHILGKFPNALMIAEESTAWPMVTMPSDVGGLGFNFKWNMGWMNDVLEYVALDPFFRKDNHSKLTFSFHYAGSENFILPISHDEVVHGKCSLLNKMYGEFDTKFDALAGFLGYMIAHPGKKHLFMGTEFAQVIEWNYSRELDWLLLSYDNHKRIRDLVRALNCFYKSNPALYDNEIEARGFEGLVYDDNKNNIVAFERVSKSGERLLCVSNFSAIDVLNYEIGSQSGSYELVLSTDKFAQFVDNKAKEGFIRVGQTIDSNKGQRHKRQQFVRVSIPSFSTLFFKFRER